MSFIKRRWTPKEADEWTKEDIIAIIISPLSYASLMVGTVLSLLFIPLGFLILGVGILITILMFYIIDPKLSKISSEYEKKQKDYIEELERKTNWEKEDE